jgi:hypothetical protein
MKEGYQIKPEWVPSAYKDEKPEVKGSSDATKPEPTALLYFAKKAHSKSRLSKTRKKR